MTDIDALILNVNTIILEYCTNPSSSQLSLAVEDGFTVSLNIFIVAFSVDCLFFRTLFVKLLLLIAQAV